MGAEDGSKDKRVVLAYSGGLDTSVILKWLMEEKGMEVITLTADLGQPGDIEEIKEKALKTGAPEAVVVDAKDEFARDFLVPAIWANASYEDKYPLATALARPLIARLQVETARRVGAGWVAHGCTGKGNDQVRFEVAARALEPEIKIIAPMREWIMTRESEIEYAESHGIPVPITKASPYSVDENIWGRSCECGILEDPWEEPPEDAFDWTVSPMDAPDEPLYIQIDFEGGIPRVLDGEEMELAQLVTRLNAIAGKHAVGRIDMVEDRVVGIKSREIYEAPAAVAIIEAHRDLERLTLTAESLAFKKLLDQKFAELTYQGLWFSPLREAIDEFNRKIEEAVNGSVKMKLFKGGATVVGRSSPGSLYDVGLATYDKGDLFDHKSAAGFIKLWGLGLEVLSRGRKSEEKEGKK
ncbi:MAG: argininosuccinate synthase [Actinomycetota bacterium]|nr:argininosuccinate synthase [Actinomycetota bacterium]